MQFLLGQGRQGAVATGDDGVLREGEDLAAVIAKLLEEAGFKDGLELTIGGYTDQDSVRRGEVIQDQLGKVGINELLRGI